MRMFLSKMGCRATKIGSYPLSEPSADMAKPLVAGVRQESKHRSGAIRTGEACLQFHCRIASPVVAKAMGDCNTECFADQASKM
jgi:hypothetical protein